MPVNLTPAARSDLHPIAGVSLGVACANIKKPDRRDLLVMRLNGPATLAAVFTQNRFCAAPVILARHHLALHKGIHALVINTGNANAGTGEDGLQRARLVCAALADLLGCEAEQVLPFSTGVIMEPLPVEKILAALPQCVANLGQADWLDAAQAIMTTDIVPKAFTKRIRLAGKDVHITGMAKGSGMIHPNMATMLGYIATDATVPAEVLQTLLNEAVGKSFNCITVDGDTSTNDACVLIATGAVETNIHDTAGDDYRVLRDAIVDVAVQLAQAIVRDGEGATKFVTLKIEGGHNEDECRAVGFAIAHSPLVKTALFASDPNLGRILAAIGNAGLEDLEVDQVQLYLGQVLVAENGGRAKSYTEAMGKREMQAAEISARVVLNRGTASATIWTCDFSYDYVKINAEYRS